MSYRVATICLLGTAVLSAIAAPPDQKLVQQYVEATQIEKTIAAQQEGYLKEYTVGAPPEERARVAQYLESTMGWSMVKDKYLTYIEKLYTAEELKAAVAFVRSPIGTSIARKNLIFSREMASYMAANVQRNTKQAAESALSETSTPTRAEGELATSDAQEHTVDGRVYFTGTLENRGKRPARGVQVEINLFSNGKFVDQYSTYISGTVVPGTLRYFKVACGCKDSSPAQHDSFKISVVEGY